jgi:hypothetical protein
VGKAGATHANDSTVSPGQRVGDIPDPGDLDPSTFEATQQALRCHQRLASRNRTREYLFVGGRLTCGRCGRAMSGMCRPPGIRYYRCGSRGSIIDPALRCSGSLRADVAERQVWAAIIRVLEQPELIAAEIAQQEARADEQRQAITHQQAIIDAALTKCDREAQRWADAYAAEVINLVELKAYRAEIEGRRQRILGQQAECQARLEAVGQAVSQVDTLIGYCARVHQRLHTFDHPEKRMALEALAIRVSWNPGQPLMIQGSIPLGDIVDSPSNSTFYPECPGKRPEIFPYSWCKWRYGTRR